VSAGAVRTSDEVAASLAAARIHDDTTTSILEREPLTRDELERIIDAVTDLIADERVDTVYGSAPDVFGLVVASAVARRLGAALGVYGLAEGVIRCSPARSGAAVAVIASRIDLEETTALDRVFARAGSTLVGIVTLTPEAEPE
jgi:hypothetical protein